MASAILSCPLRAPLASDLAPIAIAYNGPAAVGAFALAQHTCGLVNIAGDLTSYILSSLIADKFKNLTLPGISALVQAARTCKYLRNVSREVKTPIDAAIIERDNVASTEGDQNLNRQRFTLHALQKPGGMPAGARYRLVSAEMVQRNNGEHPVSELADDPFLLVYRDARNDYNRPVTMAIAKPQPNGSLLCIGISIREMLVFFGGHSTKSVFNATQVVVGRSVIDKWVYNYPKSSTSISVWGTDESKVALVSQEELLADSLNPIKIDVTPACDDDGFQILEEGRIASGDVVHRFNGVVTFSFPASTCAAFSSENQMSIDYPSHLASILGCHELPAVAVMPTAKGQMVAKSNMWLRDRRKRSQDTGGISTDNIQPVGRRAAVQAADLELQRAANEESLMEDGQFLPGHPEFDRIRAEVDEINERLEEEGKGFRYVDPRIKEVPSPKRVRTVLAIAN